MRDAGLRVGLVARPGADPVADRDRADVVDALCEITRSPESSSVSTQFCIRRIVRASLTPALRSAATQRNPSERSRE